MRKALLMIPAPAAFATGIAAVGCASAPKTPLAEPPAVSGQVEEMLRKYMAPDMQYWDGEGKGITSVYYVDPLRFGAFKSALDAGVNISKPKVGVILETGSGD